MHRLLYVLWLPGLVYAIVTVARGMHDHFGVSDHQMSQAIIWALVGIGVNVLLGLARLRATRPADFRAVKNAAAVAGALYLAHEVYEHEHERHLRHAFEDALHARHSQL